MLNSKIFEKALKIATSNLKENYGKYGLYANPYKFKNYWARDSFITSYGCCELKDFEIVRKNLDLFIEFQREDGHIPARIEESPHVFRSFGLNVGFKKLKALDKQSQPWASDVFDSNPWFILSAINYFKVTKNKEWLVKNISSLQKAYNWMLSKIDNTGLVNEGFTANWSDYSLRRGNLLYSNILFCQAIKEFEEVANNLNLEHNNFFESFKKQVVNKFWDDDLGYFLDRTIDKKNKYNYFYSDGNLLAIWFGIADNVKAKRIIKYINDNNLNVVSIPIGHPKLNYWNEVFNQLIFPIYRTKFSFLWLGCLLPICKKIAGLKEEAEKDLERIAEIIVKYNTCNEVVDNMGEPVDLGLLKSQKKQAWTAGMYIVAYNELIK